VKENHQGDYYICIHGHFYQPPRENPWLEAVELEDAAYPYHDWNEQITATCYEPNTGARILDDEGRIAQIVNNYARMSFSFAPPLLNWLEHHEPDVYHNLLAADRESQEGFSGHGSALAQIYNHVIMPLANQRDKETQVLWGVRDFEHRFKRQPEGMWLPETAVDLETLDIMAEHGIRFTILSPNQARRVRPLEREEGDWQDVSNGRIDTTRAYLQRLPSGRTIALFFYDIPMSRAVAFEGLLSDGENFARRLVECFDPQRDEPQLTHIATVGEVYGHYHEHGEMALAYALNHIEINKFARLTSYGEVLDFLPPTHEVEIFERTSWSCPHGVERWQRNCGCTTGRNPSSWNQAWRAPLRKAFDWLRDTLAAPFEEKAGQLVYDPWQVRNDYISLVLDRSPENLASFLAHHATHTLRNAEQSELLRLLEVQRQLMLMYTSAGWFYDDLSNPETVQIIKYAGRAIHLAQEIFPDGFEEQFLSILEQAKSNIARSPDGRHIYEKWVKPAAVDLVNLGAHYAVSSLSERYAPLTQVYCYEVESQDYHRYEPGMARVVVGRARITSIITRDSQELSFGVLHFGDYNVNAGVRDYEDDASYTTLVEGVDEAASRGDIAEVVRLLDGYFEGLEYSVQSLFRDAQRSFLDMMLASTLVDDEAIYRQLYERRTPLMHILTSLGAPLPRALHAAAEFVVNSDLRRAITETVTDREQIQAILDRARMWDIELDATSTTYTLQQAMEQLTSQIRAQSDDLDLLFHLEALVDVILGMPFKVDYWKIQNTYYELINTTYVEMQERADEGDEEAREWTGHFIALGDKLGVRVTEMSDISTAPTVASITHEVLAQVRIPHATYRFQFGPDFTFAHALDLVPYLDELGVSDCYASPIFKARAGSSHGYDVCDHSQINPVLGGEEAFDTLAAALRQRRMGIVLDIVPNHMGIGDVCNTWWMDVLENGPSSDYASYFDIEWQPVKPELANKVLLPTLGDQYGRILEGGELQLVYEDGAFFIYYYEHRFPIAPGTYSHILSYQLETLREMLEPENEYLQEFQSILTALSYLPPNTERDPERLIERNREKEVIKRRIATLYQESPEVRDALDNAVQDFNGNIGDPRSFDLLDTLINAQSYRLAYWRVAAEEVNYRRFFDINDLAAIRTEDPDVFRDTHDLIFRLLTEEKIGGLRIDHIDGLFDPAAYFRDLQESYIFHRVRNHLARVRKNMPDDDTLRARVSSRVEAWLASYHETDYSARPHWPLYVVVEKILSEDESLPHNWSVHGTTGYDFLNTMNNLFVNSSNAEDFDRLYHSFIGYATPFSQLVNSTKKMIMLVSMDSEIYALSHQLERIAERNRRYRDFTLNTLTFVIREVIACLSVYRTYTTGAEAVLPRDRQFIEAAVAEASRRNPRTAGAVFDFIRETLLLEKLADFAPEDQANLILWVRKFQQVSGPVMAKGVEDTAFYVYNRLVSLNEVGGHPNHFGSQAEAFHQRNNDNQIFWAHTLLTTSTHDTKRSEDVRARINILSEMPQDWQTAIEQWRAFNADKKTHVDGRPAPDSNDEYLLYQALVGAWPLAAHHDDSGLPLPLLVPSSSPEWETFRERIAAYMHKATKEAKVHTSWVNANLAYDAAVRDFVYRILGDDQHDRFLSHMRAFVSTVAYYGQFNSLAQTLLKITAPGVPDIYQGTELWDLSLVDPDNRRPVDYQARRAVLADLKERASKMGSDLVGLARDLLATSHTGAVKLYLTHRLLTFRRAHTSLFAYGSYLPLEVVGSQSAHVCAFSRVLEEQAVLAVVPRLVYELAGGAACPPLGAEVWGDTWLALDEEQVGWRYRNHLTGEVVTVEKQHDGTPGIKVAAMLNAFPVALLACEHENS
jgi:(1->4)-alpha-D-glucan 1-alpha-D-glucosylmutase